VESKELLTAKLAREASQGKDENATATEREPRAEAPTVELSKVVPHIKALEHAIKNLKEHQGDLGKIQVSVSAAQNQVTKSVNIRKKDLAETIALLKYIRTQVPYAKFRFDEVVTQLPAIDDALKKIVGLHERNDLLNDARNSLGALRNALDSSLGAALARNDTYPLLDAIGALIKTGPTGTNLNDIAIALKYRG